RMNYMRLLKLLYIAERESLRDSGGAIIGGSVVAMKRGPVLDEVYALIKNQHRMSAEWSKHFQTSRYHLIMHSDPGMTSLSRFMTRKLNEVADRYLDDDEWDMVEHTHQFPEWIKNDPGESSQSIPLQDILSAVGKSDDIDRIVSHNSLMAQASAEISSPVEANLGGSVMSSKSHANAGIAPISESGPHLG
ncbi:MAG: SocA family protein, partial [Planctomycetales bacterium]|nr:SocA family protein [Planctomycetales bacterium]